jgi:hypothetical protein
VDTLIVPLLPPKQLTFVVAITGTISVGLVSVVLAVAVQPFASVIVTVSAPLARLFAVWVRLPLLHTKL